MRNQRLAALAAFPAAAALLAATAAPAAAQIAIPTPGAPPVAVTTTSNPAPSGAMTPAAADAGGAILTVRGLPGASLPGVPGTGLLTGAIASTVVTADNTKPAGQQSTATAAPFALTLGGQSPVPPSTAFQQALPDHLAPTVAGFDIPKQLAPLLSGGLLQTSAQARYSTTNGFCVTPIATATTSVADLAAVNVLPALSVPAKSSGPGAALTSLAGLLASAPPSFSGLTALLTGQSTATTSVVAVPGTASSSSTTRLVSAPGQAGMAMMATSTVQLLNLQLLPGTPLGVTVNVIKSPTITAVSSGNPATSGVTYTAPVVQITQADGITVRTLAAVDDPSTPYDDTTFSIPLQIPVLDSMVTGLPTAIGAALQPVLGPVVNQTTGAIRNLDLGMLTVKYGQFTKSIANGASVGGTASLLDIAVLPTTTLSSMLAAAMPAGGVPSSLLQLGVGEQSARASAAPGGVECTPDPTVTPTNRVDPALIVVPTPPGVTPLAYTNAAYATVPLVWTGSALLLLGVVLVSALPRRRRSTGSV